MRYIIFSYLFFAIMHYIGFSIISADGDPFNWPIDARIAYVMTHALVVMPLSLLAGLCLNEWRNS